LILFSYFYVVRAFTKKSKYFASNWNEKLMNAHHECSNNLQNKSFLFLSFPMIFICERDSIHERFLLKYKRKEEEKANKSDSFALTAFCSVLF